MNGVRTGSRPRRAHAAGVRPGRRSAWLRALVLLLALLVPGAHMQAAPAAPAPAPAVEAGGAGGTGGGNGTGGAGGGTAAEYDHLDTAVRLPARDGRRAAAAPRLTPAPTPAGPAHAGREPAPVPPGPPPSPGAPRCVVLRC
ncbi:hypothetical protein AB0L35_18075 [Streptomyces sp. NPDC052309]|uniref:hypothetical protein n=1 Tax=Streptomyces sp. NPDC052309 TaxID=3155421 RepID=UPI00342C29E6